MDSVVSLSWCFLKLSRQEVTELISCHFLKDTQEIHLSVLDPRGRQVTFWIQTRTSPFYCLWLTFLQRPLVVPSQTASNKGRKYQPDTFMTMTQQLLGLFLLFGAGFVARCCELKYLRWFLTNFSCCLHEKEVWLLRPFITVIRCCYSTVLCFFLRSKFTFYSVCGQFCDTE